MATTNIMEKRLRRKADLIRKFSFLNTHYDDLIENIDTILAEIENIPTDSPIIRTDNELGKTYIQCRFTVGDKNITDEFFGNGGEFYTDMWLCKEAFEAKKVQLLKEQADLNLNLTTLLSPETLEQFDKFVETPQ